MTDYPQRPNTNAPSTALYQAPPGQGFDPYAGRSPPPAAMANNPLPPSYGGPPPSAPSGPPHPQYAAAPVQAYAQYAQQPAQFQPPAGNALGLPMGNIHQGLASSQLMQKTTPVMMDIERYIATTPNGASVGLSHLYSGTLTETTLVRGDNMSGKTMFIPAFKLIESSCPLDPPGHVRSYCISRPNAKGGDQMFFSGVRAFLQAVLGYESFTPGVDAFSVQAAGPDGAVTSVIGQVFDLVCTRPVLVGMPVKLACNLKPKKTSAGMFTHATWMVAPDVTPWASWPQPLRQAMAEIFSRFGQAVPQ